MSTFNAQPARASVPSCYLLFYTHAGVLDHLRPLRRVVALDVAQAGRRARLATHAEIEEPLIERALRHHLARSVGERLHHRLRQPRRIDETVPAARLALRISM